MSAKFKPPVPTLTYHLWRSTRPVGEVLDPAGLRGEGPPLYSVHKVTASRWADGEVRVYVSGPMRKRDGTQGRHNRSIALDTDAAQPDWVERILQDARTRLGRVKG